jgi:hypothetical protein
MKIEINKEDLFVLLLSTVRYSLGRMSYMPSYACELVLKYQEHLTDEQVAQIYEEVTIELESYEKANRFLGMECDHQTW